MSPRPDSAQVPVLLDQFGQLVPGDSWCFLEEDQGIDNAKDVVLGLDRLEKLASGLAGRNGRLGVVLAAGEAVERLAPFLDQLALVAIAFPAFKDGRGLSSARLLRARYGFSGEIRAVGAVLIDQLGFMLRCGFSAFALRHSAPEAAFAAAAGRFSLHYQSASECGAAIPRLRHEESEQP